MPDNWERCPRCGSNKVITYGKGFFFFAGIFMISFFWLGIFYLPLLFAFPAIGILFLLLTPFATPANQCKDCSYTWHPQKIKKRTLPRL